MERKKSNHSTQQFTSDHRIWEPAYSENLSKKTSFCWVDFELAPNTVQYENDKTSLEMNACIDLTTTAWIYILCF